MFKQDAAISTFNGKPLKLEDQFTYLGSNILSTESDVSIRIRKACTATGGSSVIWKSDLSDKIKREFFQAVTVSVLLHSCTTWTTGCATEGFCSEEIQEATLHKITAKHLPRHISQTIPARQTSHAGHCWNSRDEFISNILSWTPTDGHTNYGRPANFNSVRTHDSASRTCQKQWMIGTDGVKESRESVLSK